MNSSTQPCCFDRWTSFHKPLSAQQIIPNPADYSNPFLFLYQKNFGIAIE
jgi:hypothetical protein